MFVAPITIGIIGGKYLGRLVNFFLMLEVYQVGLLILRWGMSGDVRWLFLLPGIFVWAPVSAGGLIVALVYLLVAILAHYRRVPTQRTP
jgi:hypothetical protein